MRTLDAWIEDRRVGQLTETQQADGSALYAFQYAAVTAKDIVSLTMVPIEGELRFESRTFPPPFDMVLPEGERRTRIEEARKILPADSFSLLSYVGGNPVNRVRFLPPGQLPGDEPTELPAPAEIAKTRNGRQLFQEMISRLDLRQGIAGVQPKILGASAATKISSGLRQYRGSTHILKTSIERFPFLAANEHCCLGIFASAGIAVPRTTLSADGELLLVERFDIRGDGRLLGFEEAAALLGETSATKYLRDYGTMVEILGRFISPQNLAAARSTLVKSLVLNHLLGNGDAHLKNFGVLFEDAAQVSLAPIYDCVSTLPYIPDDIPALALSFEWYTKAWWPRTKIEEFALTYGAMTQRSVLELLDECYAAVTAGVRTVNSLGGRIEGFGTLAGKLASLWTARLATFRAEASILRPSRGKRKS
jgi:serine/threonine-protein kinase HipA